MKNKEMLIPVSTALLSALLWGLAYQPNAFFLTAFIAFVPLLIAMKRANLGLGIIIAFISAAAALLLADFELWYRLPRSYAFSYFLVNATMFAIPWILYQLIRLRHNEKLGYIALVSSWLCMEWSASQILGNWPGLQLGNGPAYFPFLIQWYSILGAGAGTLWILAINIHISRIILPAKSHSRKSAAFNGTAILLIPVLTSFLLPQQKNPSTISVKLAQKNEKYVLISKNQETLQATSVAKKGFLYKAGTDTLKSADITDSAGNIKPLPLKTVWTEGIGGKSAQLLTVTDFDGLRCGLIDASSLVRTETLRIYKSEDINLLIAYDADKNIHPLMIRCRAIENRLNILVFSKAGGSKLYHPTGESSEIKEMATASSYSSDFFARYGDLTGRLSIFVTIWMILGTIVKPFRKK